MRSPWADTSWAHRNQRGSVTAEFAAVLPAVLVLLACCLGALQVVGQQVRLTDAAASAARLLARGESTDRAAGVAADLGPGTTLIVEREGEFACARLSAASTFGPFATAGIVLTARSCALAGGP